MLNIVIVAAGKGSRMGKFTEQLPKCLAPYKGKAILLHQYEKLAPLGMVWLIVRPEHAPSISKFCRIHNLQIGGLIHSAADGSANAIASTCQHLVGQSVLFHWCDIMAEDYSWAKGEQNLIGLVENGSYRYGYNHATSRIAPNEHNTGGVIGLYYIAKLDGMMLYNWRPGTDWADLRISYKPAYVQATDIGTLDMWAQAHATSNQLKAEQIFEITVAKLEKAFAQSCLEPQRWAMDAMRQACNVLIREKGAPGAKQRAEAYFRLVYKHKLDTLCEADLFETWPMRPELIESAERAWLIVLALLAFADFNANPVRQLAILEYTKKLELQNVK